MLLVVFFKKHIQKNSQKIIAILSTKKGEEAAANTSKKSKRNCMKRFRIEAAHSAAEIP